MLNDECVLDYDGKPVMTDGKETPILEWMAAQKKHNTALAGFSAYGGLLQCKNRWYEIGLQS